MFSRMYTLVDTLEASGPYETGKPKSVGIALGMALALGLLLGTVHTAYGQQQIGYIDSEYILERMPEYESVQQQLDRLTGQWEAEIEEQRAQAEELRQEYQARELLYTEAEREKKLQEIEAADREVEQLRQQYFGQEGELYSEQQRLLRPIQERVLEAVEQVAEAEGFDYVFDKSGEVLFMYAQEQYDLSERVLEELGIDVDAQQSVGRP